MDDLVTIFKNSQSLFDAVVPFVAGMDKLLLIDFSAANKDLQAEIFKDLKSFSNYISHLLEKANAKYGIGGYGEYREVYSGSKVFDAAEAGGEPRRLHLGIDIWGLPHTRIMAPLDGIVHSFAFNDNPGDYGVTIILSHQLQGTSFHTLYGHLSLNSIRNLQPGDRFSKGDIFAEFGIPVENGQWPPHLHFQVIKDLQGYAGDYPGVCRNSEKEKYLSNCPDPDLILQMMRYAKRQ